MIILIFLIIAGIGLVLLYFQQKMNAEQEAWIKRESLALQQLQEQNRHFLSKHFLDFENSLLSIPASQTLLHSKNEELLPGDTPFRKRKVKAYHLL